MVYKNIDLYCNVEYMECQDEEYLYEFGKKYKRITALFENNRGILCYISKKIKTEIINKIEYPHLLHFRIAKGNEFSDIIVFRILVSDSSENDFKDRKNQWDAVMRHIDINIKDKSRLIMMGDWNHAYIRDKYIRGIHLQVYFNYQYIKSDLTKIGMTMGVNIVPGHTEHSYKGYLAIDHIAIGNAFSFIGKPTYSNYDKNAPIGTPDHAFLFAEIHS